MDDVDPMACGVDRMNPSNSGARRAHPGSRGLALLVTAVVLSGCPGPQAEARQVNDRDTMTVRQRDSVTATLPVPGARGIGGAMDAVDKANARAAQHDALLGGSRDEP